MIRFLCGLTMLCVLTANSVTALWIPKEDMLKFPTDEELLRTVENLKSGKRDASSPLAELAQVEENHAEVANLLIKTDKRELKLKLKPSYSLVRPGTKIYIHKDGQMSERSVDPEVHLSHYHGEIEGTEGSVALTRTKNGWRGMIMTEEGNLMIHDLPENTDGEHLMIKMRQKKADRNTRAWSSSVDVGHDNFPAVTHDDLSKMEEILNSFNNSQKRNADSDVPLNIADTDSEFKRNIVERSEENREYELEVAVYVDQDLYDYITERYPQEDPVERLKINVYLILNMVHARYQSRMIGDKINVVLIKFTIYSQNPTYLIASDNVVEYLNNFCRFDAWTNAYGMYYDLGILLTGKDLHIDSDTGVAGAAYTGGMCRHDLWKSCLISEARGFMSAFAIAHEIGHSLNLSHDSVGNDCKTPYLMGPYIDEGVVGFSECSKNELRKEMIFLDDFGHNCLREPSPAADSREVILGRLPGLNLEENAQCIFLFGEEAVDVFDDENYCSSLKCQLPNGNIESLGYPPIDGSKCSSNKTRRIRTLSSDEELCYFTNCRNAQKKIANIEQQENTPSGLSGIPLTPDELCKKYADQDFYYVRAEEMNSYIKAFRWPPMCSMNILCRTGTKYKFLDMPPPVGTPCNAEGTSFCNSFVCV